MKEVFVRALVHGWFFALITVFIGLYAFLLWKNWGRPKIRNTMLIAVIGFALAVLFMWLSFLLQHGLL